MITTDRANASYNIAVKYLQDKYGKRRCGHTEAFSKKMRQAKNKKELKEVMDSETDDDFIIVYNPIPDDNRDDIEIQLLLSQFYYGYKVRFELYNKLCIMGVIKYEE
jgi:hypothetical protein